jgi:hypothetical protein
MEKRPALFTPKWSQGIERLLIIFNSGARALNLNKFNYKIQRLKRSGYCIFEFQEFV